MPVFFFTDIEGSTRLWEEHTGVMTGVIARHDDILRELIDSCGGTITKHTGDGITAAFPGMVPLPSVGDLPAMLPKGDLQSALRSAPAPIGVPRARQAGRRDAGQPLVCALEAQKRFAAEPWGEIGALPIRVGIHAGEAEYYASAGTPEARTRSAISL